ncbi:DUF2752 domain-containing protein [Actinopolymorpha sp. B17G11]|uniref:DUF2752 domain-containing protein n=1 Tax=Actinopolymorpha sp. B17G11 TaxID=3160861 RepID=UPI0032E4CF38
MPDSHPPATPPASVLAGMAVAALGGLSIAGIYSWSGGTLRIPCLLRSTTGLACPFCGTTRMVAALLHGDLTSALLFNAPVLVAATVAGYVWMSWVLERHGNRRLRLPRPRLTPVGRHRLTGALIGLAVVFMVVRNLPWEPFTVLGA